MSQDGGATLSLGVSPLEPPWQDRDSAVHALIFKFLSFGISWIDDALPFYSARLGTKWV